jgi:hypothetical protein
MFNNSHTQQTPLPYDLVIFLITPCLVGIALNLTASLLVLTFAAKRTESRRVFRGVSMDSLKYLYGLLCHTTVRPVGGHP